MAGGFAAACAGSDGDVCAGGEVWFRAVWSIAGLEALWGEPAEMPMLSVAWSS